MLTTHEINPANPATASVIFLHGLGANGHDLMPLVSQLELTSHDHIRFIFPDAPLKEITINGGMLMPAWYDITGFHSAARQDLRGLEASRTQIEAIIEKEIARGIAPEKIILGGFSQGGALTLFTGLQSEYQLGGLIVLSAYLPCADHIQQNLSQHSRQIPIFMAHGNRDPIVLYNWGEETKNGLIAAGYNIEWHTYPIGHEVSYEETQTIGRFIQKYLAI